MEEEKRRAVASKAAEQVSMPLLDMYLLLKERGEGQYRFTIYNQSSRTSEHAITGCVATATGKRGGAIRVHSISPMEHTNRN